MFGCKQRASSESSVKSRDRALTSNSALMLLPDQEMALSVVDKRPPSVKMSEDQSMVLSGKQCSCSTTYVSCNGPNVKGAEGQYEYGFVWCAILMKPEACKSLSFKEGQALNTSEILAAEPIAVTSIEAARAHCVQKHELQHACDGLDYSSCRTEANAYRQSWLCMATYAKYFCDVDSNSDECSEAQYNVTSYKAAEDWQRCRCNGNGADKCTKLCKDTYDIGKFCETLRTLYK